MSYGEMPLESYEPMRIAHSDTIGERVLQWWYTTPLARLCCGSAVAEFEIANQYTFALRRTQRAMRANLGLSVADDLRSELISIGEEIGANLVKGVDGYSKDGQLADEQEYTIDYQEVHQLTSTHRGGRIDASVPADRVEVKHPLAQPDRQPRLLLPAARAMARPAFAGRMALYIESRYGQMAHTKANRLVAERTYTAACREAGVRDAEAHANRALTLDAYFEVDAIHAWYESRGRLPWFARYGRRNYRQESATC